MTLEWRVTIPSTDGQITISLGSKSDRRTHAFCYDAANNNTAMSLTLAWVSLLSDNPLGPLPEKVLTHFVSRLSRDIFGIIKTYSSLADALMKSERTQDDGTFLRTYVKGMEKTPVYRVYSSWYQTGNPVLLRWLLSFLSFGKVAEFDRPELEPLAFRSWYENEVRLKALCYTSAGISNVRRVIDWLVEGYATDLEAFTPHHGPGNTAERVGRTTEMKNSSLSLPEEVVNRYFRGEYSLYPDFQGYYDTDVRPAELTFVSKSFKSMRTICMEPAGIMYAQQGVRDQLYRFFETSRVSEFCTLEDQSSNQRAAKYGSATRLVDTIDLSAASDSVSWRLVQGVFQGPLLADLAATRSSIAHYNGFLFDQEKFAPMGSALCFPTQCILFLAIAIATGLTQSLGLEMTTELLPDVPIGVLFTQSFDKRRRGGRYSFPTIYGDDICLDYRLTSNAMCNLGIMGFLVNVDKSFTGPDTFRESCGKFYSRGHDVSMLKYRGGIPGDGRLSIAQLAGFIDQANRAYDFGYMNLRRYYIQLALYCKVEGLVAQDCGRNPILFSNREEEALAIKFVPHATQDPNRHLRRRQNRKLFDGELQSVGIAQSNREHHSLWYENYLYLQWQRTQWYGVSGEPTKVRPIRADYRDVVPVLRWTRKQGIRGGEFQKLPDWSMGQLDGRGGPPPIPTSWRDRQVSA